MNRPELYQKTVDLLLDAYNSGKLEHGDCKACAVGNICGGNDNWARLFMTSSGTQHVSKLDKIKVYKSGIGTIEIPNEQAEEYSEKGFVYGDSGYDGDDVDGFSVSPRNFVAKKMEAVKLIESTGYTMEELMKIEFAFEISIDNTEEGRNHYIYEDNKKGQFIGLTAVLNVLAEIHAAPETEKTSNQEKLEKVYASL